MKSSTLKIRKNIFLVVSLLIVVFITLKYMHIMLFSYEEDADGTSISDILIERGPILDRNGRILAIQTRLYSVTAWIPSIKDIDKTAKIIGDVLDIDKQKLKDQLTARNRFMYIERKISNSEAEQLREYIRDNELPGISLEPEYGRSYPEKDLASHLIGYAGTDNIGLDGIEYTYNSVLSPPGSANSGLKEIYGNQVFLTIDSNIQNFAHQSVLETYNNSSPSSITMIVADAKSAGILAYVSMPEIDLNNFATTSAEERINHPVAKAYEPGSVFKVFSIASFLQIGGIDENSTFFCNGYFETNQESGTPIRIRCLGNHGNVTPVGILKFSCNAGISYASETVSDETFYQMFKMFDFGEPTGVPLPGETNGIFSDYRFWSIRSKPTISFGQEISVSAMQVVKAATVLANKGEMLQPQIVSKIISSDGNIIQSATRTPIRQVLSPEVASSVLNMMAKVASVGSGWRARVPGISVAVKTGTSQTLDYETWKYSKKDFIATCLALFPAEDPTIIIYTAIYNPTKGSYYGGRIAAPLTSKVAEQIVSYLGIPRKGDTVIKHSGEITLSGSQHAVIGDIMPELAGYSKKQLLPLLNDERLKVLIEGEGWVYKQSPPPGTKITNGIEIKLELQ